MEQTIAKLRRVLEDGYRIQSQRNIYRTPNIPTTEDPDYKSFSHSMGEHIRQNINPSDFTNWTAELEQTFIDENLNFGRFRHRTESHTERGRDSHAKSFKRRLDELDKIVNDLDHFKPYVLSSNHHIITFDGDEVRKGAMVHRFNQSNPKTLALFRQLWDDRRIVTPDGKELVAGSPIDLQEIYPITGLQHDSFEDSVRAIHRAMKNKGIDLKIRYPKQKLIMIVTQDSM